MHALRLPLILLALLLPAQIASAAPEKIAPREAQVATQVIMRTITAALSRPTRFQGPVRMRTDLEGGLTYWGGTMVLQHDYAVESDRDGTPAMARDQLISHEAMHTISAGVDDATYAAMMGWEEGVCEGVRRILQPRIFRALGYTTSEINLSLREIGDRGTHDEVMYGTYIRALERARAVTGLDGLTFYRSLIAIPLAARPQAVRAWAQAAGMTADERRFIMRVTGPRSVLLREHYR